MRKQSYRLGITAIGIAAAAAALLWRPQAVAGGISRGLSVCADVLIPSLFPFLVLGRFLIGSGVADAIGRRLEGVTRVLFGLPGCCASGILIGLIGGYPAGGSVVGELLRRGRITREEGRRMLRFCVNGGPGFIISAVGVGLTGSRTLGVLLFVANLLAVLVLGIVAVPQGARRRRSEPTVYHVPPSVSTAFVEAVTHVCETLLSMCGFVLLFSAVTALVDTLGVAQLLGHTPRGADVISALIACVLEVSCGCTAAAALDGNAVLFLGFAVGFGGVSVHCQLASALNGTGLIDRYFFAARVAQGGMTAVLASLLVRHIPFTLPVIGGQQPSVAVSAGSTALSVALLVLVGVWMLAVVPHRLDKEVRKPYNKDITM